MKKFAAVFSALAFMAAVAALVIAAANFIARKRELYACDCDAFDDDVLDGDLDFYTEAIDTAAADLSVNAQGNTAPVGNADKPADALPQEH